MSITSVQYGAVQTAYVGYASYDLDTTGQNLTTFWPQPYVTATNILAATTNIVCTATGTTLTFPNATQVALGYNVFIRNDPSSTEDFAILTNTGTSIQTIAVGETWWVQLTAYTPDIGGTWTTLPMGSNTTPIIVNNVAGYGLEVTSFVGKLSTYTPISTITTTSYDVLATDQSSMLLLNGVSSVTLPTFLPGVFPQGGFYISFNNISTLPVTFTSTGTINGLASPPGLVVYPGQTGTLVQDSTGNWWTVGMGQGFTFAQTTLPIPLEGASGSYDLTGLQLAAYVLQLTGNITDDFTVYFGSIPNNWYIQNACTVSPGKTFRIQAGTTASPIGAPIVLEPEQNIIIYLAIAPNGTYVGQPILYTIPTIANPTIFEAEDGAAATPSFTFIDNSTSGMYLASANNPAISANSTEVVQFSGSSPSAIQLLANPNATSTSNPTYSFIGQTTTGMGCSGTPTLDLFANNVKVVSASSSLLTCTVGLTTTGNISTTGSGTLTVAGLSTLTGGINSSGNIITAGNITASGSGTLTVGGTSALNGGLSVSGNLDIGGITTYTTPLPLEGGGTGATTQAGAANAILPPSPMLGEFVYYNGTNWVSGPNFALPTPTTTYGLPFWNAYTSSWTYSPLDTLNNLPNVALLNKVSGSSAYGSITTPTTNGTYTLQCVVSGGGASAVFNWV